LWDCLFESGEYGPLCPGQTLNLTANNVSGGTYAWTGPLGFTSILQNPTISNVTTANSGNYVCTVTVGGIAGQPCTTTVVVSPIPTVTASTASSVICNGDCVNLNGGGASTYSWMPGGATGVTVSVCPAATTTYTVTGTSFSGCTNSTTINVAVNPAYLFTETQGICNGASYNWHNNNYSIVGVYYDSLTTVQGCDSIYKLNLTMNPSYLMPTNVTICNGMAYHWRGSDYSTAGTYYDSLQTIQDVIVYWH